MTNDDGDDWYIDDVCVQPGLSTSENEILDVMIYPNPVDGNYVTILSPVEGLKEIQVFTVTGRKVMDTTINGNTLDVSCLLYTSPSPRDLSTSRMPSSA